MKKKRKATKRKTQMEVITLNMDRDQLDVLQAIARDAGTSVEIVAAVFLATAMYKRIAAPMETKPVT